MGYNSLKFISIGGFIINPNGLSYLEKGDFMTDHTINFYTTAGQFMRVKYKTEEERDAEFERIKNLFCGRLPYPPVEAR